MRFLLPTAIFAALVASVATAADSTTTSPKDFKCSRLGNVPETSDFNGIAPTGGEKSFLRLFGFGTQNYKCTSGAWVLQRPKAFLYHQNDPRTEIFGSHGFTDEADPLARHPYWESGDSTCGKVFTTLDFKKADAVDAAKNVAWLRTNATSTEGGAPLNAAKKVIRVNTKGGQAPAGSCQEGAEVPVDYSAEYVFY